MAFYTRNQGESKVDACLAPFGPCGFLLHVVYFTVFFAFSRGAGCLTFLELLFQHLSSFICQAGEAVIKKKGLHGATSGFKTIGLAGKVPVGDPGALGIFQGFFFLPVEGADAVCINIIEVLICRFISLPGADVHFCLCLGLGAGRFCRVRH